MKKFNNSLFIFRRDLRLEDNTGLNFALENSANVIPSFIFTPEQIQHNEFLSKRCLQFMIESLEDLDEKLRKYKSQLYFFYDEPHNILEKIIQKIKIDSVVINRDYTPYSIDRDYKIQKICNSYNIEFYSFDDALLNPPESICKNNGDPYLIFTPYYRNALKNEIAPVTKNNYQNYYREPIPFSESSIFEKILDKRFPQESGGRNEALKILKTNFSSYDSEKDFPSKDATTKLSPHLKFNTCSIREVYHTFFKKNYSSLLRSLYWRDFFTTVCYYFPDVLKESFHLKYEHLPWSYNKSHFKLWCEGLTGFPIIDAGMRELNQTGFMHNRVRMLTASFLIKDLHIDWKWGEKYFAQNLIDYDPAINNGNWQWVASTGCDSQPYFRIFNPWTQSAKFDPECEYIKKWIPELRNTTPENIHKWYLQKKSNISYPLPIVDHQIESEITIKNYKNASKKRSY